MPRHNWWRYMKLMGYPVKHYMLGAVKTVCLPIILLVSEAATSGARQARACSVISLSPRTLQRWQSSPLGGDRRPGRVQEPKNRLSEEQLAHR